MKRRILALTLLVALVTGVAAPQLAGQASAATTVHSTAVHSHAAAFDKTKFVFHLGAAYFAFHHFVYNPYKAGTLNRHHIFNLIKGAAALAFAYHEVHTAYTLAQGSNSKTLHVLIAPMNALANSFAALKAKVRGGSYSSSDITGLNSQANSFQSMAGKNGFAFHDQQASF